MNRRILCDRTKASIRSLTVPGSEVQSYTSLHEEIGFNAGRVASSSCFLPPVCVCVCVCVSRCWSLCDWTGGKNSSDTWFGRGCETRERGGESSASPGVGRCSQETLVRVATPEEESVEGRRADGLTASLEPAWDSQRAARGPDEGRRRQQKEAQRRPRRGRHQSLVPSSAKEATKGVG